VLALQGEEKAVAPFDNGSDPGDANLQHVPQFDHCATIKPFITPRFSFCQTAQGTD
jgi:hypothetical protein